ncbi:MAG: hypothetical protein M1829_000189 [Trizodia sp. TS-e1964]|nr:MAG: hypothetical protein M1829_000189 [Trizodia sp. TS-e1964]
MNTQESVEETDPHSPSTFGSSSLSEYFDDSFSASDPDPYDVREEEAQSFYSGLPSEPRLVYRSGKDTWSPPTGPEAYRRQMELCAVFDHPITTIWEDNLAWKVVKILDSHEDSIRFTSIDVVCFRNTDDAFGKKPNDAGEEAKKAGLSPVTIWVGVFPGLTSATTAHDAAEDILALLKGDFQITNIDIHFRTSIYSRAVGPKLLPSVDELNPLVNVAGPLTDALGLSLSTKSMPYSEGTMALYLEEGGNSKRLLGLTCRHVVFGPMEENVNYTRHPSAPAREVILLGDKAFADILDSTKAELTGYNREIDRLKKRIATFEEDMNSCDAEAVKNAEAYRAETQRILGKAETAVKELQGFLSRLDAWRKHNDRVLGPVLVSPAISLGVSGERFTEDWAIFQINRDKLGAGFQGNKIDLGTKLTPAEFAAKCFPREDANWSFRYPGDRMLRVQGIMPKDSICAPNMWDANGDRCLFVVKHGRNSGTTIGRANGLFSIVRSYASHNMSFQATSLEWGILNYDNYSGQFSRPGDSGSAIVDIHGRVGGILTGGAGKTESSDLTYATPMWWVLERIKKKWFPHAHLNVVPK